jgi:hypothetical protein
MNAMLRVDYRYTSIDFSKHVIYDFAYLTH